MAVLRKRAAEGFVERMVTHLGTRLPRQTAQVADPELRIAFKVDIALLSKVMGLPLGLENF